MASMGTIILFLQVLIQGYLCIEEVSDSSNLPGGIMTQDPNDPVYMSLAEESLKKYLQDMGNSQPYRVIKIENVTKQVVAGTLTKIKFTVSPTDSYSGDVYKCKSVILEQPWKNLRNIDITCHIID